ncbi:KxYKxGKxW signal peptide domain-containing protein [Weissella cibaria]|uniref:KxYKxGKxW signal peptide domain-containing protein n=1 Tax=Weissella cibaria TaxID=137591 RepID=UPI0022E1D5B2|nr:KxYKxGKxW signal peptide domain-containing protein [Weissella cibaria]
MRQFNMNKGNFEVKSHYKMYKAGKRWVVAGMATLSLLGGLMMVSGDASADGVDSSVAPVADSQAPAETTNNATTNSVVLSASATPAPASSVSAEVSATSESSVVSSVVVSSSVASSVVTESVSSTSSVSVAVSSDASSVVSQSLASSVVVPADAVTVKDTESEKAYALGTTPDAETTPDSAVTAVDNGISTYSATPKNATWSVKSNSLVASSHIVTSNAQAKSEVTYSGSGQVTPNFKQTGDITGSITMNSSYVDGKYITNQSDLSSAIVVANDLAHSFNPIATPSNISKSDIDWQAIVPQATNEGGTLAYGTKVDTTKAFEVRGGYKVVPIVNGKLGDITNTETTGNKTNQGGGKYGGGQAVGMIMTPTAVEDMGTLKMGTNLKTLNLSDGIEGVSNALIAGRDLYYGRTGDVNPLLVHLRQTNANGALYAETKTTVNGGNGAKDILGQTVKTDGTTVGYAKASDAKNGVDGSSLGITDYVTNANGSNKTTLFTNYLSQGVYFDYIWTPKSVDGKLQTIEIADANGVKHTYIYADLTYSEYSNFAAISGTPSQADKDKYLLSSVTGTVLVQTQMALGLFGGNGGNGQSFFGGISYFQAKNVLNDVSINYQFKNDPTSLVNSNTVTALAGETVQINGGKDSVAETDGHYVSSYDAPEIKGLKVDSSKKLQAVAGTDTNLTVIYTVDQGAFDAQVTTAQTAKENVQKSIDKATAALATAKTQQDKDDITQAITQLTKISNQIDGIISGLKTATDAGTIAKLDTVDAVTSTLMKLENTAANATDLATSAADLATAVSSFSDKNTSNSATPEDVAHTRAVLEGQNASNLVTDDMGTIVQEAKKALDAAVADKTATTEDIVHKRSVLLADMAADAVAHTDDEEVQRRLVTVADAVKNGTTSEIDEAAAKLKIADSTVVSTDIADDEALNSAKNAVDNALDANPYVQTDADTAKANFDDAVTNATTKLAKAKSDADTVVAAVKNSENDDVKKRVDDVQAIEKSGTKTEIDQAVAKLKVADETVVAVNLSDDDNVKLAKQAVDDALNAKTYDQSAIDKAQSHFNEVVSDANSKLATAKTTANDAVASWTADAHKYADQDTTSIADDVAELNQLTSKDNVTATKQAIDDARQKLADDIAIVEQKRQSAVDDGNNEVDKAQPNVDLDEEVKLTVDGLKQAIADGTQTKIEEAIKKVQTAVDTMVEAKVSDSESVTAAKKVVNDVLNAADLNTDTLNKALGDLDEAVSNAKSALDTAKGNATVEEPTNLIDQIKQLAPADQDTLSTAVAKLKDLVDSKNDSTTTLTEVNEQQTIIDGILNSLKDNRKNAIGTAKKTVTADVPTNIADQADQSTLQADKDNLQKVAADDKSTLDDIQKAQQKVDGDIADMTKNVTEAKTAGKQDVAAWTDPKNVAKYTDQDTKDINDDIAALNDLTAADNAAATQKAINDARQKLADDIAIVEQKRQAAVDDGNKEIDKAQPNVNLDDEVKLTVDGLKQAIADGTQTKIEEAIKKVQTAVDTMVATNVSDSDAVNTAKQAVNDALNATDLNTDTLNKALGDLDKAVSGAKDALATAKGKATVAEPANLDDQIKKLSPADQDKLATAVANLKNLTDPKNDGTTKASDIKAQQDIVDGILKPLQKNREEAVTEANGIATADVQTNITDQADAAGATLKDDKAALQTAAADDSKTLADIKKAQQKVTDDITAMTKNVTDAKNAGNKVVTTWSDDANVAKYVDQDTTTVDADIKHLQELTSSDEATQTAIDDARKQLESDIKTVTQARQTVVDAADKVITTVNNGDNAANQDVKNRIQAVKDAESAKGTAAIDEAVSKLQNANDTVVPANVADVDGVTTAKQAVDDALNATSYDPTTAAQKVADYKKAVATAKDALKQVTDAVAAIKVPANLQDQVAMDKKNKLGDLTQQVTDLQNLATQADTTASALQPNLTDVQNRLADMTKKLHDMQADGAKLVDQFANATDDNVVKARKQLSTLLASDDATMTDIQNAMNVLKATSAPANNKPVEKQEVPVTNGQVSVPVANGDGAFVIVTDANGKQKVVQLDTADGKASANVSGAKNAQVVTVPKHGDKPFIFVTDGSGTAQYTELTPDGAKTTITPDGSKTETSTGSTIDVPAGSDVSVIYLPTADISVQAGAKNIDVPVKTGYTATVTDANGNVIEMTDGSTINVEGVPAGTNYLVTYTPDPAKVVVKLGTESGFKQGEAPATGNKNAQKLTTVADALAKLQQDEKVEAAIVSTGYTDTKVNVSNALAEMNKVDENLDIDGYAHRVVAPDGKEYASLEDAVKANPTFAAGTTQMKVIYAPLDGQKIQVKDVSGKVLGTVTGKSDAEINVNDFAPIDAVLKQTAKKDNLKITVTAPDGTTYDSLSAALAATGYFDHIGLQNGASSFDLDGSGVAPTPVFDEAGNVIGYQAVLAEAASLNDMNIQDFVVSYTPAIDDTAVSVDGNHYYNNTSNKEMSDNDVDNTVNNLHNMLENGAKSGVANAINKVKTAVNQSVAINVADSGDVQKAKQVINDILNGDNVDTGKLKQAISNLATAVAQAKQALADTKASADADGKNWQTVSPKYADQNTSAIQNDLKKLHDLTSADNTTATKTDIEQARKQLQDDIKKVDDVRQASVKTADGAVATVKNGTNDDVKNRIAAVKAAEETGTKSVIDEAVAKLQTADATVVPTNVSDDAAVIAAKRAVDDALNAKTYVPGDVAKAKQAYDQAVADAQATLRTVIDQANAIKVPANLQNNAGDLIQMVTDLQGMANRADTTVSALRTALTAVQNRLAELNAMNQGGVIDGRQGESIVNTNVATPKEPGVAMAERHESRAAATVVKANKTSVAKGAVMAKPVQAVATTTTAKQAATRGNKTASTLNNGASVAKADKQVVATTTNTPKTDADRIHDMLDDAKVNKASINMTENASENYIGIIIASLMVAGMFGLLAAFWRRQKESEKEFQARINGDK